MTTTKNNTTINSSEPGRDCALCPRLEAFRKDWRVKQPDWFNAPVPCFGCADARLIIVGLAPGLQGANRTGRPFTGDYAGLLLYQTLAKFGFSTGNYAANPQDGLTLNDVLIANAVRCVPPQNKPTPFEIKQCNGFLRHVLKDASHPLVVLSLGRIAHDAVLMACGFTKSAFAFAHGAKHLLADDITLFNSYHCSRYNTQTKRLTPEMFEGVFAQIKASLR